LLRKREKSHPHLCCRRRRKAPYPPAAMERVYLTAWSHSYWDISWRRAALRRVAREGGGSWGWGGDEERGEGKREDQRWTTLSIDRSV